MTPAAEPSAAVGMPADARGAFARLRQMGKLRLALLALFFAAPIVVLGGMTFVPGSFGGSAKAVPLPIDGVAVQKQQVAALVEGNKTALVAQGEIAKERNAEIAFSALPLEKAHSFAGLRAPGNAETCLTQAIYYEAGFEPEQGRRAVAQVVLNRVAHPAYPNSVCGVVYQGSNQRVCQFSFTCDGSLSRPAAAGAWAAARRIAKEALAGYVEPSVGTATHYHADYVLPRWAFNLGKVRQLGSHIFYRFNGDLGSARAFRALYSGSEVIPSVRMVQQTDVPGVEPLPTGIYDNGLTVAPDVKDRHALNDIGGRIDTTKAWRLELPKTGNYRQLVAEHEAGAAKPAASAAAPAPAPGFTDPSLSAPETAR